MAQLILSQGSDEVLAVLPDGAYPGYGVVEGQDPVKGWNSRPKPKFRSIHVPGAPTSDFADLMEQDPRLREKRKLEADLSQEQLDELAAERILILENARDLGRRTV